MTFDCTVAVLLAASVLASACTRGEPKRVADSATIASASDSVVAVRPPRLDPSTWAVTVRGIGPVYAGMTVAEARAAVTGSLATMTAADMATCHFDSLTGGPAGVSFMVEKGIIMRADVARGTVATAAGARIGDSEARIDSLYAGRVVRSPHKYTDGRYLTVSSPASDDGPFRIVFETDGRTVTRYRAGRQPAVEYVEGCS